MRPGQSPFDPRKNPEQALRLAESMRVKGESKEQQALDREGLGGAEEERKKSRMVLWTRKRTDDVVDTTVGVLVPALCIVFGLLYPHRPADHPTSPSTGA